MAGTVNGVVTSNPNIAATNLWGAKEAAFFASKPGAFDAGLASGPSGNSVANAFASAGHHVSGSIGTGLSKLFMDHKKLWPTAALLATACDKMDVVSGVGITAASILGIVLLISVPSYVYTLKGANLAKKELAESNAMLKAAKNTLVKSPFDADAKRAVASYVQHALPNVSTLMSNLIASSAISSSWAPSAYQGVLTNKHREGIITELKNNLGYSLGLAVTTMNPPDRKAGAEAFVEEHRSALIDANEELEQVIDDVLLTVRFMTGTETAENTAVGLAKLGLFRGINASKDEIIKALEWWKEQSHYHQIKYLANWSPKNALGMLPIVLMRANIISKRPEPVVRGLP